MSPPYQPKHDCPSIVATTHLDDDDIPPFCESLSDLSSIVGVDSDTPSNRYAPSKMPSALPYFDDDCFLYAKQVPSPFSSGNPSENAHTNEVICIDSGQSYPNVPIRSKPSGPGPSLAHFGSGYVPSTLSGPPSAPFDSGCLPSTDHQQSYASTGLYSADSISIGSKVHVGSKKIGKIGPLVSKRKLKDSAVVLSENRHLHYAKKWKNLSWVLCQESIFGQDVLEKSTVYNWETFSSSLPKEIRLFEKYHSWHYRPKKRTK